MKKRMLSVLLALTLCFTMFAGMALAEPVGRLERNVNRVDNMLNNVAIQEQKDVIDRVVGGIGETLSDDILNEIIYYPVDPEVDPEDEDYNADYVKKDDSIPYLITPTMLEVKDDLNSNETMSYFILLMLSEDERFSPEAIDEALANPDEAKYPNVAKLVKSFNDINVQYDTAGESLNASLGKFDDYGDALTELYTSFMEDKEAQLELFDCAGVLDQVLSTVTDFEDMPQEELDQFKDELIAAGKKLLAEHPDWTRQQLIEGAYEEVAKNHQIEVTTITVDSEQAIRLLMLQGQKYAYDSIRKILADVIPDAFQSAIENYSFEEGNGLYLEAFRALMNDDAYKKQAAIVIGKDIMKLAASGAFSTVSKYARARKWSVMKLAADNQNDLFDPTKEVVLNALKTNIGGKLLSWIEDDANGIRPADLNEKDGDLDAEIEGKIKDLVDKLEERELTLTGLNTTMEYILGKLDPTEEFQNIWYNLGLNRITQLTCDAAAAASNSGTAMLKVELGNDLIDKRYADPTANPLKAIDPTKKLTYVLHEENEDVNLTSLDDIIVKDNIITYTNAREERVVNLFIYRGSEPIADGSTVADNVGRYVADVKVTLPKYVVTDPNRSVTITNKDELEKVYAPGDPVTVEADVKGIELVILAVAKENTAVDQNGLLYVTLTPQQAKSFTFKLPDNIEKGRYSVVIGNEQFAADSYCVDSSYFDVDVPEVDDPDALIKEVFPIDGKEAAVSVTSRSKFSKITQFKEGKRFYNVGFNNAKGYVNGASQVVDWNYAGFAGHTADDYDAWISDKTTHYDEEFVIYGHYSKAALENLGFKIAADNDLDERVEVTITYKRGGSSGGGGTISTTYFTDGTKYDNNKTIHLVGETRNTRVVIDLVGPDGKVLKSVTLAMEDFIKGYDWDISDLVPLAQGTYVLQLKSTTGTLYDERKFNVGNDGTVITSDIFNKDDHFNYILGFDDGTVRPEAYITRDEVAAIMFRLLKDDVREKNLTVTTDKFTDIPEGHWSMTAFATLNTLGIYEGRGNGIMGCGDDITRAEFAALCSRFAVESATGLTSVYTDIAGNWAEKEIMAVTAAGWFQGDDNKFRPDDKITRAEVVTVMNRILERDSLNASAFGNEDINAFSDLSSDKWYYIAMVEATTAHDYEIVDGMEVWKTADDSLTDSMSDKWKQYE